LGADSTHIIVEVIETNAEFGPASFTLFLLNYTPEPYIWTNIYPSGE
jgi:hypothetical protein